MSIEMLPLSALAAQTEGPRGVFTRYLAAAVPEGRAPAARVGGALAFAVAGPPLGHPEASFGWIVGAPGPALDALLAHLRDELRWPALAFDPAAGPAVAAAWPGRPQSRDLLLTRTAAQGPPALARAQVVSIDPTNADGLPLSEGSRRRLPPARFWARTGFRYLGLVDGDAIPATAEYTVSDGRFSVIQQVYTDPAVRGRGLARRLIAAVAARVIQEGRIPLYVGNEGNPASLKAARAAGFEVVDEVLVIE